MEAPISVKVRIAYLVIGTILGGSAGRSSAEVPPIAHGKSHYYREAFVKTEPRVVPFVLIGAAIGAVAGMVASRMFHRSIARLITVTPPIETVLFIFLLTIVLFSTGLFDIPWRAP